ncbi:IS630 family transposase [Mucilaginibacter sp. RCC_168]|uniref:IS630 family transposase n=1 Tax=Mucilaginibacter sp. RCC_168 TaxID=3239221 RepID=UPI003526667E
MDKLVKSKINIIRRYYIKGEPKGATIARELQIQKDTVYKYFKEFREIERLYPHKLKDFTFLLPKKQGPRYPFYDELMSVLPDLVENTKLPYLEKVSLWKEYRQLYPRGCGLYFFYSYFNAWQKRHKICKYYPRRIKHIAEEDIEELTIWRNSQNIELWRKAVVVLDSLKKRPVAEMCVQVEVTEETILKWIARYQEMGIEGLRHKTFTPDPKKVAGNKLKQENILRLLQQTPKLHGLNRTAWRLTDMSRIYEKVYGSPLGPHAIGKHLNRMGYQFQKSRERLTSPDKHYQEKMDNIKSILSNLKPDEKFFSIDEYGPAVVNIKTGWSLTKVGEIKTVPQLQKSRGWYIMTAALELSTNQMTHFYSQKKNTEEMLKLVDVLIQQYKGNSKLYLSWDCAPWHSSNKLKEYIKSINAESFRHANGTPWVELAPLPSSAQYLNVIESVFSGMAKSVIHNSDYASLDECQSAINLYFTERNQYFQANPKKAGKKIWGKEIVKPVFMETNNCKSKLKLKRSQK